MISICVGASMPRSYIPVDVKRTVIMRAKERCEYCQSRADYTTETFAVEHIIPLSHGGTDELANLAFPFTHLVF